MTNSIADRFIEALQSAEKTGQVNPLVDLFADGAELRRQTGAEPENGRDGALRFWQEYLASFRRVRSEFTNVIEADGTTVLEWVSDAEPASGPAFQYAGVSILETDGDRVQRFRTYYDSARLVPATTRRG